MFDSDCLFLPRPMIVGGGYVISPVYVSVCLLAGLLRKQPADYIDLDVMTGPTNEKNWSTFGGDLVMGTDSRSLLHCRHHCGIGHLRRFICRSHTLTGRFWHNDWRWQWNESTTFGTDHTDTWYRNSDSNPVSRIGRGFLSLECYLIMHHRQRSSAALL